jgi:hypothetical protein
MAGRKPYSSWAEVFEAHLRRGNDHGYAAFKADEWEARQKMNLSKPMPGAIERTTAHWFPVTQKPEAPGWYPVLNLDGSASYRFFEEDAWWLFKYIEPDEFGEDGGWHLTPNNSFSYWTQVEVIRVACEAAEGSA